MTVRSDGDIVLLYNGNTDNVSATDYERVDYAVWNGTSWSVDTQVDGNASTAKHYYGASAVLDSSNDDTHFFWYDKSDRDWETTLS